MDDSTDPQKDYDKLESEFNELKQRNIDSRMELKEAQQDLSKFSKKQKGRLSPQSVDYLDKAQDFMKDQIKEAKVKLESKTGSFFKRKADYEVNANDVANKKSTLEFYVARAVVDRGSVSDSDRQMVEQNIDHQEKTLRDLGDTAYQCKSLAKQLDKLKSRIDQQGQEQNTAPAQAPLRALAPAPASDSTQVNDTNIGQSTSGASKPSNLDDYADTSTEMPDYFGGDD
jgi:hypothetical protein